MNLGLDGKIAIVTGGSKGIGLASALTLLEEGASVMICARGEQGLAEFRTRTAAMESRAAAIAADLTQADAATTVIEACRDKFGGLDILVNNAGSARNGDFLTLTDQAWIDDWTLKALGYVRMARAALPIIKSRGEGAIVNIVGAASIRFDSNYTIGGMINAGLLNFSKALARLGAPQVRVIGINPGPILTERLRWLNPAVTDPNSERARNATPMGRVGHPQEVADLVAFLVSKRASFVSGTNITIDGGSNPGLMG